MKKNLIRVFVNEKNVIEISPYSSLYSLRDEIQKKIYKNVSIKDISLYCNGKPLIDNKKSILLYNIENNSNISANIKIKGGVFSSKTLLIIIYILSIPLFFLFLSSGMVPLMANIFSFIFDNTVVNVLEYFNRTHKDAIGNIIRHIIKIILWVVTTFSTALCVWAISSYMIFPYYYLLRGRSYCDAGLAAKHVGKVTMGWYMLIYCSFNVVDYVFNILQYVSSEIPFLLVQGITSSSIQSTRNIWDIVKFTPMYYMPFFGQILMSSQEMVDEILGLLYKSLDMISQYNCNDTNTASLLCSFFTQLEISLQKLGHKAYHTNTNQNITKHNTQQHVNKVLSQKTSSLEIKKTVGAFIEPVKNYKLSPLIHLLQRGFCDQVLKDDFMKKGLSNLTDEELQKKVYEQNPLLGTPFDSTTFLGRANRWSSSAFTSIFCQILEALRDITNTLWNIGTEEQVANMIKTGQIAGIVSIFVFIIDTILN